MSTRKILLIGIDGLRLDDALGAGAAPHLAALLADGVLHRLTMEVPTISGPGWSSLLTGLSHAEHGVFDNSFHGHTLFRGTDLLTQAFAGDPLRGTFVATGWPPIADPQGPGPIIATRLDQQRVGLHRIVIRDGETYGYRYADGDVAAFARLAIRDAGPHASFVYLGEVDEAGHLYGGVSPEYTAAIGRVDEHLGSIVDVVRARAASADEDWLVGVTTDHGHLDQGGHGGDDPVLTSSFLALARFTPSGVEAVGAGAEAGTVVRPVDVPRILLSHLD
ncbi:alkaline phosphatase family protein [Frondihabitans australicus]|uniref:Type I phosphodiesterase/nucleotide pyrophosphatase n=1 Tax=Frondihabitans australicus TaxID=386892 RepID=A0A495IL42_9MICO|nr:alkaline phosphatase family protein [Frondihabitans australicus]RKR76158.1 type I phosphodiesterase/nucleotide pyrophosphatase [Frondihabitans australicus]